MIVAKRRLSTVDHSVDVVGMTYVYPVVSRRAGGVSVGVNLNPNNACNWRCAYCQVDGLVLGAGPVIDLERLENELRRMLSDIVDGDFFERAVPSDARVLKDIAFAGNGEPTTSPSFAAAVAVVGRVLSDFGLLQKIPVVLITNGSQVTKEGVLEGLTHLATLNGEVWFKLDAATHEGMLRVNQTNADPVQHIAKLHACAAVCPTWIQTCVFAWDGKPPSDEERLAYVSVIRSLVADAVPVRGVYLYSVARASKQAQAPHVSALPLRWLEDFASEIRAAGIDVKVSA